MLRHNIIVIGGSAGAIVPLIQLVQGFPCDLPAAVFIVVHTSPNFPNTLPEILQRSGSVVLSGLLYDGTAGLIEIKERGGVAIVQDPKEAAVPCMPQSAIKHVTVDHVLSMADMIRILSDLSHEPVQ